MGHMRERVRKRVRMGYVTVRVRMGRIKVKMACLRVRVEAKVRIGFGG